MSQAMGPGSREEEESRATAGDDPFPSALLSAIYHLSLPAIVTNICHGMGAPSPSLALMKEQKSLEAIVPKCPSSSIKPVPALIPPGSS